MAVIHTVDPFDFLEVDRLATADVIKQAFRAKCRVMHPDKNKSAFATEQFQQLNEAYKLALEAVCVERPQPILCKCGRATCEPTADHCAVCMEERAPTAPRAPQSKQQQAARRLLLETTVARAEGAVRALKRKRDDLERSLDHAEQRLRAAKEAAEAG